MSFETLIVPFLTGGFIIAGVKYASVHLKNPVLASIFSALPVGLFSIFWIVNNQASAYGHSYAIMNLILLLSTLYFVLLLDYFSLSKNVAYVSAIAFYYVLVMFHYFG